MRKKVLKMADHPKYVRPELNAARREARESVNSYMDQSHKVRAIFEKRLVQLAWTIREAEEGIDEEMFSGEPHMPTVRELKKSKKKSKAKQKKFRAALDKIIEVEKLMLVEVGMEGDMRPDEIPDP